jgi:catechol 2,3-dioxygenase-like lactoylglutathione lyase family enzyme
MGEPPESLQAPPWRGIHHLALITPDRDATVRFYRDVLGMQLIGQGEGNQLHGRTAFLRPGEAHPILHFFEDPKIEVFSRPDAVASFGFVPGALQHIAFALPTAQAGLALRARLRALEIPLTEVMRQDGVDNMLFPDNNGMLLEAAWPRDEYTHRPASTQDGTTTEAVKERQHAV